VPSIGGAGLKKVRAVLPRNETPPNQIAGTAALSLQRCINWQGTEPKELTQLMHARVAGFEGG
jgi:hypothetical protein